MRDVKSEIKLKLRDGLEKIEAEIWRIRDQYLHGGVDLQEYLDRRSALETEKARRVLENLRKLHRLPASKNNDGTA